jgi:hypothetical protein
VIEIEKAVDNPSRVSMMNPLDDLLEVLALIAVERRSQGSGA